VTQEWYLIQPELTLAKLGVQMALFLVVEARYEGVPHVLPYS
jgi:hypothetical protein